MATFKEVFDLNEDFYSAKIEDGKYRILSGRQFRNNFQHHDDATHVLHHDKDSDRYSVFRRDHGTRKIGTQPHDKFHASDDKLHPERPAAPERKSKPVPLKSRDEIAADFLKRRAENLRKT